ncbi:MAG: hypothetical protein H3C56_05575, partial [Chitinophagaceae bacterium]|nr:hypothetical protein [Chitinophagaceae bacterium]
IDTVVFTSSNQITLGPNNNITWYTDGTNGFGDSDPSNDTMRVTYNAPLTGTFTVGGTNPDYATPALAAAALANGVGGPVVFDIRPGTYTGQVVVNGPIAGTSAVNTITFKGQNKTTTIISGNTSTALFLINNASHVVVRDLTITNINTSTPVGIAVVGSSGSYNGKGTQLINCNVNVPIILSGTSSVGYGIIFTGTAGGYGLTAMGADSVLVDSCTITGGGYGLVFYGSSNSNYNRGNVFSNNLIDKCNYQGGYIAYQYNPVVVKYNTFNIQGQNYGFYGLYFYFNQSGNTSISHEIIGNRINNFGYYGLYCYYPTSTGSAAPVKIYNNVLISYNTGSYTGYYGIYLYNGNANSPDNVKVFHNTIIMRGTQTSNTATCFYYFGASYITIKNNVFAVYSGGYTPLYLSTNPVGNTVNYNNYYNATGQTANLLYRGSFFNSSTYQTATSGGDSSFNVSPSFVNINATPYPNVSMANGCDGKALDLTSEVPNDIVHATRSAANSTVGAYEFAGSALNSLAVQPLLTPVSPITTGTQDLIYTVKNTGSNLVYNYNASYKLNANTPVTMAISNTLAPCESDTIVFTSTNQVTLGLTNNLKWYTDSPNNTSDANAADDTMSVVLVAPLAAGTYTVGGVSPDFATVSAAVAALANGIGGPVVFDIRPGTYFGQYSLNGVIAGASNVNTITFKGSGASTCRLTGNYATAIFTLNGTKYVTIRDITIENTNTGTTSAISICGASRKILLNNVTARMPILTGTSSTGYCINVSGTVGGNGITTGMSDSITVDSCRTVGAGTGVTFYGSSSNSANAGMVLSNTVIDSCNYMGAYIYYNYNPVVVRNNTINMQGWNYGYYGIYFFFNQSAHTTISHEIIGNRINNFGYYGIYLYFPISTGSAAPVKIFNNVVVSQNTGSYTGFYGIYLYNGYANSADNLKVYHNTIIMRGTQTSNSATCLYYSGASYLTAKNNIFAVYSGGYTPLYLGTNPVGNTINYNNYYNATGLTSYLVYRGSYYTSANYKVATAGGDSSFNLAPSFINLAATPYANLELDNGCDGYGVDLTTEVPTDIEGTTRNASTITPGAYEFTNYVANNLAVKGLASPAPPISFGSRDVKYAVRNVGTNSVTSFMANYKLNNNTPISQYISSTIAPCAVDTVLFTGANQVTLGVINNLT